MARYGIALPDRQLACAPQSSPEGRAYLAAMAAAANFAFANRHAMAHEVRSAFGRVLGPSAAASTRQVYDVAHNVAKLERHGGRMVCVHRKGATRAFPAGSTEIPDGLSRGRAAGVHPGLAWAPRATSSRAAPRRSSSRSGRPATARAARLSRTRARHEVTGAEVRRQLERDGIVVRCASNKGLAEEAPLAYKDVERVVAVVETAGLARRVARLRPLGVVKG